MQRLTWFLIVTLVIPYLGFTSYPVVSDRVDKVIIDAGHGGKDPGNLGTRRYKTYEKDVALAVAIETAKEIEKKYPDVEVVLTRDSDKFLELYERTALANREKGDLFISIHCDAVDNKAAYGTTTYVMGKNHDDENQVALRENSVILMEDNYQEKYEGYDPLKPESYIALTLYQYAFQTQSIELAQIIQNSFKNDAGRRDRGVKQQPLYVTSRCSMPSVLVELGYLTNSQEEDFLLSSLGQKKMANAIVASFGSYKNRRESNIKEQETKREAKRLKDEEEKRKENLKPTYFIQLAVSGLKKPLNEKPFSNLERVSIKKEGRLYRYLQGDYNSKSECQKDLLFAKNNGFPDAFIVAFKNNEKISLTEAERLSQ
ncbi:MAG: hypothetical protein CL856_04150 [Cryomorphaceae bacterium]|jgi:N-acetylmuramoyl-L-alanine amidase|nr:hypothetical protein [Cryomorphaceae bacterium]|tara:strand:+ start:15942 stop:17057 length:1116 start_codon:yes stop_codon:yes gene_type:complete